MTADNLLLDEEKVVECFTLPALRCAWERVLKKDAQDGDISDSVERFAEGVQERLEELAEELRAGTYRPSDLTRVVIPKKNGERFLDIPSVRDRIVERAILEHINPAIDPLFGATAFGYRTRLRSGRRRPESDCDSTRKATPTSYKHRRSHEGKTRRNQRPRPPAGCFGDTPRQGCWRTTKNTLRYVCHLTRGFTPLRTDPVRYSKKVRRGGV